MMSSRPQFVVIAAAVVYSSGSSAWSWFRFPPPPRASSAATHVVCEYNVSPAPQQPGRASIRIEGDNTVTMTLRHARRDTLYTLWIDFRNRATGELAPDYPPDSLAEPRGVAPGFASTAGATSGMGLDPNAIVTDAAGNATLKIKLDYDLLAVGKSPVVSGGLTRVGANVIGGGWLRKYQSDPLAPNEPSLQVLDNNGLPELYRSTPQGLTIIWHAEKVSHGHSPGLGGVDHFEGYFDDFPDHCKE